jgi:hypothetical protein
LRVSDPAYKEMLLKMPEYPQRKLGIVQIRPPKRQLRSIFKSKSRLGVHFYWDEKVGSEPSPNSRWGDSDPFIAFSV